MRQRMGFGHCYRRQRRWKCDTVLGDNVGGSETLLLVTTQVKMGHCYRQRHRWKCDTVLGDNSRWKWETVIGDNPDESGTLL